jgi:Concanavalin A-like lectin/glucanases superfamily
MKKYLILLFIGNSFNINAQKAVFSAHNNEPTRVVQSALSPKIVTNGLIVQLDANYSTSYSGIGSTWTDIAGNNIVTIVGGTFTASGGVSYVNFPTLNVASYVSIPHTKTPSMTFSVWAKASTVPVPNCMLFDCGLSGSGPDFFFAGTGFYWNIWDSYSTPYNDINNTTLYHPGIVTNTNWHNYTITVDATNSNSKFYFDGVFQGTSIYRSPTGSSATAFYLGGAGLNGSGISDNSWNFIGGIAAFLSYNRVLTQAEITANFNAVKSRYGL